MDREAVPRRRGLVPRLRDLVRVLRLPLVPDRHAEARIHDTGARGNLSRIRADDRREFDQRLAHGSGGDAVEPVDEQLQRRTVVRGRRPAVDVQVVRLAKGRAVASPEREAGAVRDRQMERDRRAGARIRRGDRQVEVPERRGRSRVDPEGRVEPSDARRGSEGARGLGGTPGHGQGYGIRRRPGEPQDRRRAVVPSRLQGRGLRVEHEAGRQAHAGQGMEFPVLPVPVDETLEVQGDAPARHVLAERDVVARRHAGPAVAPAHPVLVDVHHEEAVRRPHGVHLALAVAQRLVVRVRPAAVHVLEMVRALERLHPVRRQVDAFDLNEGREHLPTNVRDRAGRGEGPLARNSPGRLAFPRCPVRVVRCTGRLLIWIRRT